MRYVVDASVAVKWLFPEEHTDKAEHLLAEGITLSAPDLLLPEVANALWKRVTKKEVTAEAAYEALAHFLEIEIAVTPANLLLDEALKLACAHRRTVYDSLYLALAVEERATLITADRRFFNAIHPTPLADQMAWIGTLKVS